MTELFKNDCLIAVPAVIRISLQCK